jgi:RNA polymerase sigma factor (sigma-70 family)
MAQSSEADQYLLDHIRQGSGDAWSQLVARYEGRLLAFARSKVRQVSDAEDLVQDTFVSFLRSVSAFRGQASIETYLFSILRRKILDVFRGSKRVCLLQDACGPGTEEDAPVQLAAPDATASFYARREEDREGQRAALSAALSDVIANYKTSKAFQDLQIIEMLFYCQLRNKHIAEMSGVRENYVAVLKHRCLQQIRERVQEQLRCRDLPEPPDSLLSEIWQDERLSCPKRSTLGAQLLGTLEPDWQAYVEFHVTRLGCHFCAANLQDLQQQTSHGVPQKLRERIMHSTVGFFRKA